MERSRILLSVFLVLIGLLIVSLALDLVPIEESKIHAPRWLIGLIDVLCIAIAIVAGIGRPTAVSSICAGVFVMGFTLVTGWIALFGESENFSGNLPLLSARANTILARVMFGAISAMGLAISIVALRKSFRKKET